MVEPHKTQENSNSVYSLPPVKKMKNRNDETLSFAQFDKEFIKEEGREILKNSVVENTVKPNEKIPLIMPLPLENNVFLLKHYY